MLQSRERWSKLTRKSSKAFPLNIYLALKLLLFHFLKTLHAYFHYFDRYLLFHNLLSAKTVRNGESTISFWKKIAKFRFCNWKTIEVKNRHEKKSAQMNTTSFTYSSLFFSFQLKLSSSWTTEKLMEKISSSTSNKFWNFCRNHQNIFSKYEFLLKLGCEVICNLNYRLKAIKVIIK